MREAEHLSLDTGSVSVLDYNPRHDEVSVIARWNDTPMALTAAVAAARSGDTRPMKQRAIERWENEGGHDSVAGAQALSALKGPTIP